MSLTLTRRDVEDAFANLRDSQRRLSGRGETITGHVVQSVEVAAGALANGVVSGRFGNVYLGKDQVQVPVDLLVGLGGHALAFFGFAGKYDEHLHNFSDGFLAGYLTKVGAGLGAKLAMKAGKAPHVFSGNGNGGALPPKRGPLTEAELVAMAQAVR